jgi:hypothetical protein
LYARRYILLKEFVKRIEEEEEDVILYIVEMAYGKQRFIITDSKCKRHLQVRCEVPLWHKENMINLGVKLLPPDYKAFAWIDADIEFDSVTWAKDTLRILNGSKDIVQLFSHAIDMYRDETNINIFNSFGYSYTKNKKYTTKGIDYWHPGFGWAITRKAYEKIGGLYDKGILGSGDSIMALSLIGKVSNMNNVNYHIDYNTSMVQYQENAKKLRLGYTPGVIRHHYHGTKQNRKYVERWKLLMEYQYSPIEHLKYDEKGILIPTAQFPPEFKDAILQYFKDRKEDD